MVTGFANWVFPIRAGVIFQAWVPPGHVLFLPIFDDSCPDKGRSALKTSGSKEKYERRRLFLSGSLDFNFAGRRYIKTEVNSLLGV